MATGDTEQLIVPDVASAPLDYTVPNAQMIEPLAITAVFDGTAASGSFTPTLEIISDSGHLIARVPCNTTLSIGGSAEATWAPFLDSGASAAAATASVVRCAAHVAAISVANGGTHILAFDHFRTSDATVFGTCIGGGPINNAPGDTDIRVLKIGAVQWRCVGQWAAVLTRVTIALNGSDGPFGNFTPENTVNTNDSPGIRGAGTPVAQSSHGWYGNANVGDRQSMAAQNIAPDGLAHNINGAVIQGFWVPGATETVIY